MDLIQSIMQEYLLLVYVGLLLDLIISNVIFFPLCAKKRTYLINKNW